MTGEPMANGAGMPHGERDRERAPVIETGSGERDPARVFEREPGIGEGKWPG